MITSKESDHEECYNILKKAILQKTKYFEDVNLKGTYHYQQNDSVVSNSFDIEFPMLLKKIKKFGFRFEDCPNTNNHKILQLNTWLCISFL